MLHVSPLRAKWWPSTGVCIDPGLANLHDAGAGVLEPENAVLTRSLCSCDQGISEGLSVVEGSTASLNVVRLVFVRVDVRVGVTPIKRHSQNVA